MPKAAQDRVIFTTTRPWPTALAKQHADNQKKLELAADGGANIWHVLIHTMQPGEHVQPGTVTASDPPAPYVEASFQVAQFESGALAVVGWTISGTSDVRLSENSRFPLRTYGRAAVLAVVAALEKAGDLTYEQLVAKNHPPYPNGFEIAAGRVRDLTTRKPLEAPKRTRIHSVNGAHRDLHRVVEVYREAIKSGSRSPTVDVAHEFNVSRATAARSLAEARRQGLLGAALQTAAGERRDPPPKTKRAPRRQGRS